MTHKVSGQSVDIIFRLIRKHDDVRYWFNAYGKLVGSWKAKNGIWYAVGHESNGDTVVYKTIQF